MWYKWLKDDCWEKDYIPVIGVCVNICIHFQSDLVYLWSKLIPTFT